MYGMLTEKIKTLSVAERIVLVEEIWESIILQQQSSSGLTKTQHVELNKRIDSYRANPSQGKTWNEITQDFHEMKNMLN